MDGSLGRSAQSVNDVSLNISNKIDIPVCLWDERLSTVGAFNISSQLDINVSKREKKYRSKCSGIYSSRSFGFSQ